MTSSSVLARLLQVKELFVAFVFINLLQAFLILRFFTRLTSSPNRPTKKLKMAKQKNVASSSWPKKSKLPKDRKTPSHLQRYSCRLTHHFDFSNYVDDHIDFEEMEDPSKSSDDSSAFGEEALSEKDSKDISSAPSETETTKHSISGLFSTFTFLLHFSYFPALYFLFLYPS